MPQTIVPAPGSPGCTDGGLKPATPMTLQMLGTRRSHCTQPAALPSQLTGTALAGTAGAGKLLACRAKRRASVNKLFQLPPSHLATVAHQMHAAMLTLESHISSWDKSESPAVCL